LSSASPPASSKLAAHIGRAVIGQPTFIETAVDEGGLTPNARPRQSATLSKGPMAEWLRRGLQILARRFDSGSGLHFRIMLVCLRAEAWR
jgi:hypothetical protein